MMDKVIGIQTPQEWFWVMKNFKNSRGYLDVEQYQFGQLSEALEKAIELKENSPDAFVTIAKDILYMRIEPEKKETEEISEGQDLHQSGVGE